MRVDTENWLQAQYSVLGSALISPEVVPRVITETSAEDYSGPCRTVYEAMADIFNSGFPVDPVSVNSKLGGSYRDFLVQLMEITPTAANVEHYIAICRDQARVASCREIGSQLVACESIDTARTLVEGAVKALSTITTNRSVTMSDSLKRFFEKADKSVKYISWPIQDLGKYLYVGSGKFLILGAEPSVGKTAFALMAHGMPALYCMLQPGELRGRWDTRNWLHIFWNQKQAAA